MSRLKQKFAGLNAEGKTAFIPFIMGGDPSREDSLAFLKALPQAGADIIEIGMPFSDPMADGPVIEAAGNRALDNGMTLQSVLEMVSEFRADNDDTPIVLMGYANPPYQMGWENFAQAASKAGVDGLILVDIPPEEEAEVTQHLEASQIDLIRLVTPTANAARREVILKSASGFVYYVSVAGITGDKSAENNALESAMSDLRAQTDLPLAIGFGIKTPEQAKAAAQHADAVVVGSAIVKCLHEEGSKAAVALVEALAMAVHSGE